PLPRRRFRIADPAGWCAPLRKEGPARGPSIQRLVDAEEGAADYFTRPPSPPRSPPWVPAAEPEAEALADLEALAVAVMEPAQLGAAVMAIRARARSILRIGVSPCSGSALLSAAASDPLSLLRGSSISMSRA